MTNESHAYRILADALATLEHLSASGKEAQATSSVLFAIASSLDGSSPIGLKELIRDAANEVEVMGFMSTDLAADALALRGRLAEAGQACLDAARTSDKLLSRQAPKDET